MPRHVFRSVSQLFLSLIEIMYGIIELVLQDIGSISDGEKTRSLYGDGGLRYLHKDMHVRSLSHHSGIYYFSLPCLFAAAAAALV